MSANLFCVLKCHKDDVNKNKDCLVPGGIYNKFEDAKVRGDKERTPLHVVWIEEYSNSNGVINVITKENMVKNFVPCGL